jgi:hypothetical protein
LSWSTRNRPLADGRADREGIGVLRLFLAWRLSRMLFPLMLFGSAALALTSAFRGQPRAFARGQSSLAHAARGVERAVKPLVPDARNAVTQALTGATR